MSSDKERREKTLQRLLAAASTGSRGSASSEAAEQPRRTASSTTAEQPRRTAPSTTAEQPRRVESSPPLTGRGGVKNASSKGASAAAARRSPSPVQQVRKPRPSRNAIAPETHSTASEPVARSSQVSSASLNSSEVTLVVRATGEIADILDGSFERFGSQHDRPMFKNRLKKKDYDVLCYFWDDFVDNPEEGDESQTGWWFGPEVGASDVWAYNPKKSQLPPTGGWHVPWDGAVDDGLVVQINQGGAAPVASAQQKAKAVPPQKAAAAVDDYSEYSYSESEPPGATKQIEKQPQKQPEKQPDKKPQVAPTRAAAPQRDEEERAAPVPQKRPRNIPAVIGAAPDKQEKLPSSGGAGAARAGAARAAAARAAEESEDYSYESEQEPPPKRPAQQIGQPSKPAKPAPTKLPRDEYEEDDADSRDAKPAKPGPTKLPRDEYDEDDADSRDEDDIPRRQQQGKRGARDSVIELESDEDPPHKEAAAPSKRRTRRRTMTDESKASDKDSRGGLDTRPEATGVRPMLQVMMGHVSKAAKDNKDQVKRQDSQKPDSPQEKEKPALSWRKKKAEEPKEEVSVLPKSLTIPMEPGEKSKPAKGERQRAPKDKEERERWLAEQREKEREADEREERELRERREKEEKDDEDEASQAAAAALAAEKALIEIEKGREKEAREKENSPTPSNDRKPARPTRIAREAESPTPGDDRKPREADEEDLVNVRGRGPQQRSRHDRNEVSQPPDDRPAAVGSRSPRRRRRRMRPPEVDDRRDDRHPDGRGMRSPPRGRDIRDPIRGRDVREPRRARDIRDIRSPRRRDMGAPRRGSPRRDRPWSPDDDRPRRGPSRYEDPGPPQRRRRRDAKERSRSLPRRQEGSRSRSREDDRAGHAAAQAVSSIAEKRVEELERKIQIILDTAQKFSAAAEDISEKMVADIEKEVKDVTAKCQTVEDFIRDNEQDILQAFKLSGKSSHDPQKMRERIDRAKSQDLKAAEQHLGTCRKAQARKDHSTAEVATLTAMSAIQAAVQQAGGQPMDMKPKEAGGFGKQPKARQMMGGQLVAFSLSKLGPRVQTAVPEGSPLSNPEPTELPLSSSTSAPQPVDQSPAPATQVRDVVRQAARESSSSPSPPAASTPKAAKPEARAPGPHTQVAPKAPVNGMQELRAVAPKPKSAASALAPAKTPGVATVASGSRANGELPSAASPPPTQNAAMENLIMPAKPKNSQGGNSSQPAFSKAGMVAQGVAPPAASTPKAGGKNIPSEVDLLSDLPDAAKMQEELLRGLKGNVFV